MRLNLILWLTLFVSTPAFAADAVHDWMKSNEPNEHAFTVEAPKNWDTTTGVARRPGTVMGMPWVNSSSPDRATSVFVGNPSLPMFILPGGVLKEGQTLPGVGGGVACMRYKTGQQFAVEFGPGVLPKGCSDVKLEESKEETEIEAKAIAYMGPQKSSTLSVGSAQFSYMLAGEKKIEGLIVETMVTPGIAGNWSVVCMWGYRTSPGNENQARQILDHVKSTLTPDAQWAASQMMAMNNRAAQNSAMLQQQAAQGSAMLKQQSDASQALLNARHEQGMAAIENVGNRARAQAEADAQWHQNAMVNHYGQMAVKDNNNYHEILMIQNKHLEWSPELHGNVAVPNY